MKRIEIEQKVLEDLREYAKNTPFAFGVINVAMNFLMERHIKDQELVDINDFTEWFAIDYGIDIPDRVVEEYLDFTKERKLLNTKEINNNG